MCVDRSYEVRPLEENQWAVINSDGDAVFVGRLGECEDWLDFQEQLLEQPERAPSLVSLLWRSLCQIGVGVLRRKTSHASQAQERSAE